MLVQVKNGLEPTLQIQVFAQKAAYYNKRSLTDAGEERTKFIVSYYTAKIGDLFFT